ncbi:hypothetical protein [Streptomyces sp. NPDC057889]|uniref:hypothetical protein n=1 Tax=unclassified Streptomyces TaxID=2593676 RepID=UPI0036B6ABAB
MAQFLAVMDGYRQYDPPCWSTSNPVASCARCAAMTASGSAVREYADFTGTAGPDLLRQFRNPA